MMRDVDDDDDHNDQETMRDGDTPFALLDWLRTLLVCPASKKEIIARHRA